MKGIHHILVFQAQYAIPPSVEYDPGNNKLNIVGGLKRGAEFDALPAEGQSTAILGLGM